MRAVLFVLLVYLSLASIFSATSTVTTAQTNQGYGSANKLITAFLAVQKADSLRAPPDQIAGLSTQLNSALDYYNTANRLLSEGYYANATQYFQLANDTSTIVTAQALILQNEAENRRTIELLVTYAAATVAAAMSALLVLEYHHIPNFLRRRKLLSTKIRTSDADETQS